MQLDGQFKQHDDIDVILVLLL